MKENTLGCIAADTSRDRSLSDRRNNFDELVAIKEEEEESTSSSASFFAFFEASTDAEDIDAAVVDMALLSIIIRAGCCPPATRVAFGLLR